MGWIASFLGSFNLQEDVLHSLWISACPVNAHGLTHNRPFVSAAQVVFHRLQIPKTEEEGIARVVVYLRGDGF